MSRTRSGVALQRLKRLGIPEVPRTRFGTSEANIRHGVYNQVIPLSRDAPFG